MDSDSEDVTAPTPISILSAEIKDLRNKMISVKKSVTKGDKKQKKAVQDELNSMEILLAAKQEELQKLKDSVVNNEVEEHKDFVSKAKLKKERRKEEKAAEWESNRRAALEEISSRPDLALEESKSFAHRLSQEGFRILEVSADGHCLFSAIGCQLDPPMDHWELRKLAGKYLREHREEYENYLELEEDDTTGGSIDKFEIYCRKIESTGMWGGQIELDVLSHALDISITVIQAEGPEINFNFQQGSDSKRPRIYLSFHRFAFSLGEHYNALLRN